MKGVLLVALAAMLWGTVGVATSLMAADVTVDAAVMGLTRTTLGAGSLLVAAMALRVPWPRPAPVGRLLAFGLAGAVFQICLFAAFERVGVTVTVAVTVCAPVILVAGADAVLQRHAPARDMAAAIAIAVAGVLLAMFGGHDLFGTVAAIDVGGAVLLATASVAFAVVAAAARSMARVAHPLRVAGLGLGATALALSLVALVRSGSLRELAALPGRDLALLAYTGVAATGGAYLAFTIGLALSQSAGAGLAATLIEPGVAAVLAALVLGERLAAPEIAGCGLMLAAMVLLFVAERRAARRAQPA